MPRDIKVRRLHPGMDPSDIEGAIWRCCKHCGDDICPSENNMAYCDQFCKIKSMNQEMGINYGSGLA